MNLLIIGKSKPRIFSAKFTSRYDLGIQGNVQYAVRALRDRGILDKSNRFTDSFSTTCAGSWPPGDLDQDALAEDGSSALLKKAAGGPFKKAALLRDKLIELKKQQPEDRGARRRGDSSDD